MESQMFNALGWEIQNNQQKVLELLNTYANYLTLKIQELATNTTINNRFDFNNETIF